MVIERTWDPIPVPPGRYRLAWKQGKRGSERNTLVEEIPVQGGEFGESGELGSTEDHLIGSVPGL